MEIVIFVSEVSSLSLVKAQTSIMLFESQSWVVYPCSETFHRCISEGWKALELILNRTHAVSSWGCGRRKGQPFAMGFSPCPSTYYEFLDHLSKTFQVHPQALCSGHEGEQYVSTKLQSLQINRHSLSLSAYLAFFNSHNDPLIQRLTPSGLEFSSLSSCWHLLCVWYILIRGAFALCLLQYPLFWGRCSFHVPLYCLNVSKVQQQLFLCLTQLFLLDAWGRRSPCAGFR